MKKAIVLAAVILSAVSGYCQQATEKDKQIYYDCMEWQTTIPWKTLSKEEVQAKNKEFAGRYGLSDGQLLDVLGRVRNTPLTDREKGIVKELKDEICVYGRKPAEDPVLKVCREFSAKKGIRLGEVLYLWSRSGCYRLSPGELELYYEQLEWAETLHWENIPKDNWEAKEEEFVNREGFSLEQFYDIGERVSHTPLSAKEEEVAQELKQRLSAYGKNVPDDVRRKACKELSAKYGMRLGQVLDVYNVAILGITRKE